MKNLQIIPAFSVLLAMTLSSCSVIGDIFKAGMGVGIFLVVALVIVVLIVIKRMGKK